MIDIFSLPLKYPFNTASIDTKNTDGARAINANFASGICKYLLAIISAPKNNIELPTNPRIPNNANAILNILYAPLLSPTATLLDTSFEMLFGTPTEEIVRNSAYIWNAAEYIAFPLSPKPCLFVRYNLYIRPTIFIITCESIKTTTPCIKPVFLSFLLFFLFILIPPD